MKKLPFICLLLVFFVSCSVKLAPPAQTDADRAAKKYPGLTLAELNEGKSLYENNCTGCHRLKDPISFSEPQWNQLVPEMVAKLNKHENKEVIGQEKQQLLLKYLLAMGPLYKENK